MGRDNCFGVEKLRAIIRETEFDSVVKTICGTYSRMDELDSGLDWALSRNPIDYFINVSDNFFIWKTERFYDFPKIRILFQIDPQTNTATLCAIQEIIEN